MCAGAGAWKGASIRTAPVNHSAGPFADGAAPLLLISMIYNSFLSMGEGHAARLVVQLMRLVAVQAETCLAYVRRSCCRKRWCLSRIIFPKTSVILIRLRPYPHPPNPALNSSPSLVREDASCRPSALELGVRCLRCARTLRKGRPDADRALDKRTSLRGPNSRPPGLECPGLIRRSATRARERKQR